MQRVGTEITLWCRTTLTSRICKRVLSKITLFKLGKEEVETSSANGEPWDNVIALPAPGVSNAHVAKYGLNGTR